MPKKMQVQGKGPCAQPSPWHSRVTDHHPEPGLCGCPGLAQGSVTCVDLGIWQRQCPVGALSTPEPSPPLISLLVTGSLEHVMSKWPRVAPSLLTVPLPRPHVFPCRGPGHGSGAPTAPLPIAAGQHLRAQMHAAVGWTLPGAMTNTWVIGLS